MRGGQTSCGCLIKETISARSRVDITGERFGRLIAIKPTNERYHGQVQWIFECDCGNNKMIPLTAVRSGTTKSCGCLSKDVLNYQTTNASNTSMTISLLTEIRRANVLSAIYQDVDLVSIMNRHRSVLVKRLSTGLPLFMVLPADIKIISENQND